MTFRVAKASGGTTVAVTGTVATVAKAVNLGFSIGKIIFSKKPLNEFVEVAAAFALGKGAGIAARRGFEAANKAGLTKFFVNAGSKQFSKVAEAGGRFIRNGFRAGLKGISVGKESKSSGRDLAHSCTVPTIIVLFATLDVHIHLNYPCPPTHTQPSTDLAPKLYNRFPRMQLQLPMKVVRCSSKVMRLSERLSAEVWTLQKVCLVRVL